MRKELQKLVDQIRDPDKRQLSEDYGETVMYGSFGIIKTAVGLLSGSFLVTIHGMYSLMNARAEGLNANMVKHQDPDSNRRNMIRSGLLVAGMSVAYIITVILTRGDTKWDTYSGWLAWAMLAVQVGEIVWNIACYFYYSKKHNLSSEISAVVSLSGSLVGVALVQTCLLFPARDPKVQTLNITTGIIMGLLSTGLGIFLVYKGRKINN
ncbi:MAG: hypothetical protein HUJ54_06485 [Erysipelotrichaceae bacterium]|nr:hypothetical protein [Erysipelotrichaceae bacterium]